MPKASVIIATYNWSSVLPYSVGSALEQSEDDLEVIVVGDACTDDSRAVVASMGDPRVRWHNLEERHGHQSGPNSEGLRLAESDVIFYLSHDDIWMPHHVSSYLEEFASGFDLVYGITASVRPSGEVQMATARLSPFRKGMWIPPTGIAHLRRVTEKIGGWRDYRRAGIRPEIDLVTRVAEAGFSIGTCPRLTAIKFPALHRPNVYVDTPSHEQKEWFDRMHAEPDLEAKLLGQILDSVGASDSGFPITEDISRLGKKIWKRVRKRLSRNASIKARIDASKQLKGSDS